ncbi:MAG: hypothetical protein H0X42_11165 [Solirubrobacterales bacterium]|nr:hypothetical protein [Solirubrobacterales bacterium]
MEILRNLFGTLTSGVIRLLVTVGIIAAVGYFLVRPALDTANKGIDSYNKTFENSFGPHGTNLKEINKTIENVNHQVQVRIQRSFHVAKKNGHPDKLIRCIKRSNGDVHRIQRCAAKF